jgi:hypothetical protein
MKEYKLVKTYPGSPELGSIVNELSKVDIKDYPEYWEEFRWHNYHPKGWQILEFERTKKSIAQSDAGKKFTFISLYQAYSTTDGSTHSLKSMMIQGECYNDGCFIITAIKDTVTGIVLRVGDYVQHKASPESVFKLTRIDVAPESVTFHGSLTGVSQVQDNTTGSTIVPAKMSYDDKILSLNDLLEVWGYADLVDQGREVYELSPLFQSFKQKAEENKWKSAK